MWEPVSTMGKQRNQQKKQVLWMNSTLQTKNRGMYEENVRSRYKKKRNHHRTRRRETLHIHQFTCPCKLRTLSTSISGQGTFIELICDHPFPKANTNHLNNMTKATSTETYIISTHRTSGKGKGKVVRMHASKARGTYNEGTATRTINVGRTGM